jgi:hypothetical protein
MSAILKYSDEDFKNEMKTVVDRYEISTSLEFVDVNDDIIKGVREQPTFVEGFQELSDRLGLHQDDPRWRRKYNSIHADGTLEVIHIYSINQLGAVMITERPGDMYTCSKPFYIKDYNCNLAYTISLDECKEYCTKYEIEREEFLNKVERDRLSKIAEMKNKASYY